MPALLNPIGVELGLAYVLVGPDGTRAVINDSTDPDWVGYLSDPPTGLERAGIRENADTLPEADGGVHGAFRRDRLAFTLQGFIPPDPATSWLARQDRLLRATDALSADGALQWTPSAAVPVQLAFRAQQPTRITGKRPKTFLVAGVSEGSVVESQALHSTLIAPAAAAGGGFSSPVASPLVSNALVAGAATIVNAGRSDAWPQIIVSGPASNPVITNATIGRSLYLAYTLAAGEFLAIDTNPRRRQIRLNDQANRYSALDFGRLGSGWWPLRAGNNDIRLGFTSYSTGATVELRWRDAWG